MASMSSWGLGKTRKKSMEREGEKARRAEPKVNAADVMVLVSVDSVVSPRQPPLCLRKSVK